MNIPAQAFAYLHPVDLAPGQLFKFRGGWALRVSHGEDRHGFLMLEGERAGTVVDLIGGLVRRWGERSVRNMGVTSGRARGETAYELRISDWSSDVCSSDLATTLEGPGRPWLIRSRSNEYPGPGVCIPPPRGFGSGAVVQVSWRLGATRFTWRGPSWISHARRRARRHCFRPYRGNGAVFGDR